MTRPAAVKDNGRCHVQGKAPPPHAVDGLGSGGSGLLSSSLAIAAAHWTDAGFGKAKQRGGGGGAEMDPVVRAPRSPRQI